jgi:transcription-repair coupling factor (superfamily II helicase)
MRWDNLIGCADALALASLAASAPGLLVVVTPDQQTALRLEHELAFFLDKRAPLLHFPDWETLPYDTFSPLPEIVSQRLETLARLDQIRQGILVVTAATLMQRLGPRRHIAGGSFALKVGEKLDLDATRARLERAGYQCVSQVLQHGEFAVRGAILDLFPMGNPTPFRIDLFDDEVESIRTFDTESQRSLDKVTAIRLFPAREFPFDEESIKRFRPAFRAYFPEFERHSALYREVSKGVPTGGIEYYLPLFVEQTETLFDYLPEGARFALPEAALAAARQFCLETQQRYEQRKEDIDRPALPPELLYLSPDELQERLEKQPRILIGHGEAKRAAFACESLPDLTLKPQDKQPVETKSPGTILDGAAGPKGVSPRDGANNLQRFLAGFAGRTLFVAETAGRREALLDTLRGHGIQPKTVASWVAFLAEADSPCIVVAPLDQGAWVEEPPLAIISETQLSGEKVRQRRRQRRSSERHLENIVQSLAELDIGAPVVHREHGVGRYLGLKTLDIGGIPGEYLTLEYDKGDKLYVPVASLHLIGRYGAVSSEAAPLHRLGSEQWEKAKRRALEKIRDVAAELLDIQARRAARSRPVYASLGEEYAAFAAGFPFEETPDQENAIREVLNDLLSPRPMDRVVCGDVGFGKTEVAMRAAFVAAQSGKQVTVLVPTTLLAQQHFQNFSDRFADWPIRVETLSRFVSAKQQALILEALVEGKVDIVVGTHKLLQADVRYKNLGLIIIDEEHRFGVRQKEQLKKLRGDLDLLTLTATPIPRTLNMALSGLRDISIIASPPANRHPIKTFVSEWSDALVQEACQREIRRGGQIYFLHNKIETMDKAAERLARLLPEARLEIAHGQIPERELERIMLDFYHQRFNLLLCTTIIESGIDVPSANTILINRADMLGLAQLHQLRGRVGRSHHRAYAYLLVPPKALITADAVKRLEAIEAAGELGAGFMLSSHDMEIRGAGELLGEQQSGDMEEIGFSLYTELLERAVKAIKSGKRPELDAPLETGPEIDLQCPALIPDDYLPDVHQRLVLYKRIANAQSEDELRELQVEMIDRFGLLPEPCKNLFAITSLKLLAATLGIRKIEVGAQGGRVLFHPEPPIDPLKIILLMQGQPKVYRLDGPDKLRFTQPLETAAARLEFVRALLEGLSR